MNQLNILKSSFAKENTHLSLIGINFKKSEKENNNITFYAWQMLWFTPNILELIQERVL